jgi:tRNA1(Val) A37 N6-methylase TrmN6
MDQFHFKDLNFHQADFFETDKKHPLNSQIQPIQFDFILGNPPWKKDKSPNIWRG